MRKFIDVVVWNVNLFVKCIAMDVKNMCLEMRIQAGRKKTEKMKKELESLIGEIVE